MRATEAQHNTREQVATYLAEAEKIVAELEIEGELRVPAFLKAVDLLSAKQIFYEQPAAIPAGILRPQ